MKDSKHKQSSVIGSTADQQILRRMEQSKLMLERLRAIKPVPPAYADSILQSAISNKPRVLEALLSSTEDTARRTSLLTEIDNLNRNAPFYAAAHASLDSIELLSAADASFTLTDKYHRTVMHYAALNDISKLIEAVFLAFKSQSKPLQIYGQKEAEYKGPIMHMPVPLFEPYKGLHDDMDFKKKSTVQNQKEESKDQQFSLLDEDDEEVLNADLVVMEDDNEEVF